jgi:hypothetical protein
MVGMLRFTIRDVILLTVIVALLAALLMERQSRRNERLVTVNWASEEEREWAKVKFKAAKSEFDQFRGFAYGRTPGVHEFCSVIERFAQTAEVLPADPEMRLKELEAALAFAKEQESVTRDKYDQEVEPLHALNRIEYTRADVETRLKRVQREVVLARAQK